MLTVGIDTGGTFTDVFINSDDSRVATVKVPTTPHDLTVCFGDAIRASAERSNCRSSSSCAKRR